MNLKVLGESLGLEEDEFIEIVELFLETAIDDIHKLEEALTTGNCEAAADAAHSLKGASGNLGFMAISDLSATIENQARNACMDSLPSAIPTLGAMLADIQSYI
jgi:HPt (histidine-containing phosphotransfer) domain-containing protein